MTKVFIADSHPLTREGLATTLAAEADLEVCGQAADGPAALAGIAGAEPDVVVVEVGLPGMNGLVLTEHVRAAHEATAVVIVSRETEAICAERALRAGARAYVLKQEQPRVAVEAVRAAAAGRYHVSTAVMDELFEAMARCARPVIPSPADVLSEREMELFQMTGEGLSTQDIADRMELSVKTVESYRNRAKQKLNVRSNTDLMRQAIKWLSDDRVCYSWTGCVDAD